MTGDRLTDSQILGKASGSGKKHQPPPVSSDWAYFLDVDGTLIEFANSPNSVNIDDELLGLMARLHRFCGGALALVSGRSLADLDQKLGSVNIPFSGQHGLERRDAVGQVHVHATAEVPWRELRERLDRMIAGHPTLLLEDKGTSLALHYRRAPELASWIHRQLRQWMIEVGGAEGLQLQKGKFVVEIKPLGYDKGSAIAEFMAEPPFSCRIPVFIGDDVTDEHGFKRVNEMGGLTIKVGKGKTIARYRLASVGAVREWLAKGLRTEETSQQET